MKGVILLAPLDWVVLEPWLYKNENRPVLPGRRGVFLTTIGLVEERRLCESEMLGTQANFNPICIFFEHVVIRDHQTSISVGIRDFTHAGLLDRARFNLPKMNNADFPLAEWKILDVHHDTKDIGSIALFALAVEPDACKFPAGFRPSVVDSASIAGSGFWTPVSIKLSYLRNCKGFTTSTTCPA